MQMQINNVGFYFNFTRNLLVTTFSITSDLRVFSATLPHQRYIVLLEASEHSTTALASVTCNNTT